MAYNVVPADFGGGKYKTNFTARGKMFNEIESDILYTPSPVAYKVNPKCKFNTRNAEGPHFPRSRRSNKHMASLGQGPASYYCPGQFDRMARKTHNIKFRAAALKKISSWSKPKPKFYVKYKIRKRRRKSPKKRRKRKGRPTPPPEK